jgi:hypothetical protein
MDEKHHSESEIRKSNHDQGTMDSHGFAALRIPTKNEWISLISRAALFTPTPRSRPRGRMSMDADYPAFCHLLPSSAALSSRQWGSKKAEDRSRDQNRSQEPEANPSKS